MTDEPRIPTLEDMQAIAEAAARAAVEASETDRARATQAGAEREASARGITLPEGFMDQLGNMFRSPDFMRMIGEASASATIEQLEARGAFGESNGEGDGETPREAEGEAPREDAASGEGEAPRKTFAERFLGL